MVHGKLPSILTLTQTLTLNQGGILREGDFSVTLIDAYITIAKMHMSIILLTL